MSEPLALKYRPRKFDEVVEQKEIVAILKSQIQSKSFKSSYLFVGSAGTGKTTCARIFANEINEFKGSPIELDAASNSGVDDVKEIIRQAQTRSIDSEYKVFILDEVHSLSSKAWQALLKLIEEPPSNTVFIFCTTESDKVPKTILSRCQRFDFKRISDDGIIYRVKNILYVEEVIADNSAIVKIAKKSEGCMRQALMYLDKCISYLTETNSVITDSVVDTVLGLNKYNIMFELSDCWVSRDSAKIILIIQSLNSEGTDLKQFIRQLLEFSVELNTYILCNSNKYISIPDCEEYYSKIQNYSTNYSDRLLDFMDILLDINSSIKWDNNCMPLIIAKLVLGCCDV